MHELRTGCLQLLANDALRGSDMLRPASTHQPAASPRPSRRRYGLIGPNGCGKSCLLKALGARDLPIPEHIDVYLLDREIPATDLTALEVRAASGGLARAACWRDLLLHGHDGRHWCAAGPWPSFFLRTV